MFWKPVAKAALNVVSCVSYLFAPLPVSGDGQGGETGLLRRATGNPCKLRESAWETELEPRRIPAFLRITEQVSDDILFRDDCRCRLK